MKDSSNRILELVLCTLLVVLLIVIGAFCITVMESLTDESVLRKRAYSLAFLYIFSGLITYSVTFVSGDPYVNYVIILIGAFIILAFSEIFVIVTSDQLEEEEI